MSLERNRKSSSYKINRFEEILDQTKRLDFLKYLITRFHQWRWITSIKNRFDVLICWTNYIMGLREIKFDGAIPDQNQTSTIHVWFLVDSRCSKWLNNKSKMFYEEIFVIENHMSEYLFSAVWILFFSFLRNFFHFLLWYRSISWTHLCLQK